MKNGWKEKSVGEILQLEYGKPLDKSDRKLNGRFPVYGANGEKDRTDKFYHDRQSIIVGRKGSAGEINLTEKKFWPLDVTYFVRFDEQQHDLRFLYYLLITLELTKLAKGVKPGINRNEVYSQITRVPPLSEQQRIVDILDEAFDAIAIAKANAERNLRTARAVFESHLQSVFAHRGEGWKDKRLEAVAESISTGPFGTMLHRSDYVRDGIPIVNPMNIVESRIVPSSRMMVNEKTRERLHVYVLKAGDVVIGRRGELGRCALVTEREEGWLCGTGSFFVRLSDCMDGKFFVALFGSHQFRERLERSAVGTTMSSLNHGILNDLPIPVPPIAIQKKIMTVADELKSETQRLESIYQRKLAALEALKKSLLHQAFEGELTAETRESVVIPFPTRIPKITTTDLHAGILAIAYQLHAKHGKHSHFGHVKAEKIAHMIEAHLGIDLERSAIKDAAGPNDYPHLKRVEHRAKKAGFFLFQESEGSGYRITKYRGFNGLVDRTRVALGDRNSEIDALLKLMLPLKTKQAEILATVYAAWNNLLLDRQPITDEAIVFEARENWHPDKLGIKRNRFFDAIIWMREKGLIPTGKGKKVNTKPKKN